jgi:hypothetical protein
MDIYIDKENLKSFIKSRNNPNYKDCYDDCCRMLKRQLRINYNFEKTETLEDELNKDGLWESYSKIATQGNGWSEDVDEYLKESIPSRPIVLSKFPPRRIEPNSSFMLNNLHQHSNVFLINDEKASLLQDKGTSLIGPLGQEINTLKQLFCGNDYDFHKLYDTQNPKSFSNWEQLSKDGVNLPLSDIVIMDRYIGSQEDIMQFNLIKLIEVLTRKVKETVNVVLFCNRKYNWKDGNGKTIEIEPNWNDIKGNIKKFLFEKTGNKCNVTIVFFPSPERNEKNKQKDPDHDRIIFTNYMLYKSGDSFCYYNSKGVNISSGISLDVYSLAQKGNYEFAISFLEYAQKIYDKVKQKNNSELIIGDKKSNYITF